MTAYSASQNHSLLLSLPPESRNIIYGMVVLQQGGILISRHGKPSHPPPALTRTCRLCRLEALPMYYSNDFSATLLENHHTGPTIWQRRIGPEHCAMLKSLTLKIKVHDPARIWDASIVAVLQSIIAAGTKASYVKLVGEAAAPGWDRSFLVCLIGMVKLKLWFGQAGTRQPALLDVVIETPDNDE